MFIESNDQFLASVSTLFEKSREKGTVWITLKRYSYEKKAKRKGKDGEPAKPDSDEDEDMEEADAPAGDTEKEYPCIMRAVAGKKKLSTLIQPADMDKFLNSFSTISRVHMDSLKKKERVRGAKKAKPATKAPKSS